MKRLWWVALALAALALIVLAVNGCRQAASGAAPGAVSAETAAAEPTSYVCPMHPNVTSDRPGECPECGMGLVPQGQAAASDAPCCEDHPDAAGAKASGKPTGAQAGQTYVCPMHPEVTSTKADARCPECGMFLEPKQERTAADAKPAAAGAKPASAEAAAPKAKAAAYVCPMHPEVTSDKPGRCPECNMFLKARS